MVTRFYLEGNREHLEYHEAHKHFWIYLFKKKRTGHT